MQQLSFAATGTALVSMTLLLLFGGLLPAASAGSPINFINPALGGIFLCSNELLADNNGPGGFDRASCEQTCRYRYGYSPAPGFGEQAWEQRADNYFPGYYLLSQCIDDCNRQFWREFDRQMENTKKGR